MSVIELTEYEYHADRIDDSRPSVSRSILQTIDQKTPAHAKAQHPRLNPQWEPQEKAAFDVGNVAHQLILDGAAGVQVIEYDSWRTNAAKEARDQARAHGLIPLLEKDWQAVSTMMAAVREQIDARDDDPPLFTGGTHEVTLVWEDRGCLVRARLDYLTDDHLNVWDFKTTTDAEPGGFSRGSFFKYGYDLQDALYRRGVRASFGVDPTYRLVVVEKEPPHQLIVFDSAPDTSEWANLRLDRALDIWRECLETGEFPGYDTRTHSVTVPPWLDAQWAGRQAA